MHIAVVGAGPAGAWAAILLARRGHFVTLIDPQAPWEKPCGGGVTAKALSQFGIFTSDLPRKNIDQITIYFGDTNSVTVTPHKPLAVLSGANWASISLMPRKMPASAFYRAGSTKLSPQLMGGTFRPVIRRCNRIS